SSVYERNGFALEAGAACDAAGVFSGEQCLKFFSRADCGRAARRNQKIIVSGVKSISCLDWTALDRAADGCNCSAPRSLQQRNYKIPTIRQPRHNIGRNRVALLAT